MVSSFELVVPQDEQTIETVEAYFEHYLERLEEYLDADGVEDVRRYRQTVDRLEDDRFQIYVRYGSLVSEHVDDPGITTLWRIHDTDDGVVRSPITLARAVRRLEDARADVRADERTDWRGEQALDELVALLEFAIEHGYGVRLG